MGRFVRSFQFVERYPGRKKARIALLGVFFLVVTAFFLLQSLKFAGVLGVNGMGRADLRGAAFERIAYDPAGDGVVSVHVDKGASLQAGRGEKDVELFNFSVTSHKAAKIDRLVFSLHDGSDQSDLESLQLYIDGEYFSERSFFEGKGTFDDVHVRLHPGNTVHFRLTGSVSPGAQPGHRLKVGFAEADDLVVKSIVSERLSTDLSFPARGPAVSVIGAPL